MKPRVYVGISMERENSASAAACLRCCQIVGRVLAVAVLGLVITGAQRAAAATLLVDDDHVQCPTAPYTTISAAVAAASPGDTIQVCAGMYNELVVVDKTLTILGAQSGVDARTRSVPITSESVVGMVVGAFQIEADNVVIDGFTIQGVAADPSQPPFTGLGAGVWTNPGFSGTHGGHQILNNIIQNNIMGIYLNNDGTLQTKVFQNVIQNNSLPGPSSGNGIYSDLGLVNAVIDSNNFSGHTNSSVEVFGPASGLAVTRNALASGLERIVFGSVASSNITGNVSMGSMAINGTIRLFGGDSGIAINSNTLLSGVIGIRVDDPFAIGVNSGIQGHQNCITGNSAAGLEVDTMTYLGSLDALNNWWGSTSGPMEVPRNLTGMGDKIIDPDQNVAFNPWLTSPPTTAPMCPAAPPPPNTPGKATGGGKIESSSSSTSLDTVLSLATILVQSSSNPTSVGAQATFGFSVACCAPKGNLQYNDHSGNVTIKATSIMTFVISQSTACPTGQHAQFGGMAKQNGSSVSFTVDVDDCGEPGSSPGGGPDMFKIQTTAGYMASGPLVGGNIQIHKQ